MDNPFRHKLLELQPNQGHYALAELSSKSGYSSYDEKTSDYVGKQGIVATNLRPAGTAIIDGKRVDVVTRGDYIEEGPEIRVTAVEGARIVVRKK